MAKYEIEYDPVNGRVFRDSEIVGFAKNLPEGKRVIVANESVVNEVRCLVKEGLYNYEDVQFFFTNSDDESFVILINEHGRLDRWWPGFCDVFDNHLNRLIDL